MTTERDQEVANLVKSDLYTNYARHITEYREEIVRNMLNSPDKDRYNSLSFSEALEEVKAGWAIQRSGWNGKNMAVKLQMPDAKSKMSLPYLYIEYPNGDTCPWLASQTDILAEDWSVIFE